MFVSKAVILATVFVFFYAVSDARHGHGADIEHMQAVVDTEDMVKFKMDTVAMADPFKWKSCGSSSDSLVINDLNVTPDPLSIPGTFSFNFNVTIQEIFDAPLKLVLKVQKHVVFWLTIPCIEDIGSCTYDDVCQKLVGVTCPKPFVDNKIPCKCPFTKGNYSLPITAVKIKESVPDGNYRVQAQFTYGSKAVNCIQIYFNID